MFVSDVCLPFDDAFLKKCKQEAGAYSKRTGAYRLKVSVFDSWAVAMPELKFRDTQQSYQCDKSYGLQTVCYSERGNDWACRANPVVCQLVAY